MPDAGDEIDASVTSDASSSSQADATVTAADAGIAMLDASSAAEAGCGPVPFVDAAVTACPAAFMGELCAHGRYFFVCAGQPSLSPTDTCEEGETDCTSPCLESEFGVECAQSASPPLPTCRRVDVAGGWVPYCCPCTDGGT